MRIRGKIVEFSLYPDFWDKERTGIKTNTVQHFGDEKDQQLFIKHMNNLEFICMVNEVTGKSFTRRITDISQVLLNCKQVNKMLFIISWKHE